MGKQVLQLSEDDFDYSKFAIKRIPSRRKNCNYEGMKDVEVDNRGNYLNPFKAQRKKSKRFLCFEALRRDISLEQLAEGLRLSSNRGVDLLKKTYDQVKRCYFS